MNDVIKDLFETILERKEEPTEGSYTCYLLGEGPNKILKKCGEEMTEVIIAAKELEAKSSDKNKSDLENEICDVIYHTLVLMVSEGLDLAGIEEILKERSKKIGNKKATKVVDRNS